MIRFIHFLSEKGLSDRDIRVLAHADFDSEEFQKIAKALDYWCREWKGKRLPTPLRIVYCLDHLRMIALPFLDTAISQDKFWGIAIDNLIIYKKAIPQVSIYEASGVLRQCSYDTYQNWPAEGHSKYGIRLPTVTEVRQITVDYREEVCATINFLRRYGLDFQNLECSSYWVQSLEPPYPMSISVVEADHIFVRQQPAAEKPCVVRPVLNLFEEKKGEGLDFIGSLDKYCMPDRESEKFSKKLSKK